MHGNNRAERRRTGVFSWKFNGSVPVCTVFTTLPINFFPGEKFMWKEDLQRLEKKLTADWNPGNFEEKWPVNITACQSETRDQTI
jgi:hypothetical protein